MDSIKNDFIEVHRNMQNMKDKINMLGRQLDSASMGTDEASDKAESALQTFEASDVGINLLKSLKGLEEVIVKLT